jgi:osmoprotectant transport system permease protein
MSYLANNLPTVMALFGQHLELWAIVLAIAVLIAVPMGVLAVRVKAIRGPLLGMLDVIYSIPSLALFVLLIPLFGLGVKPAVVALVAYAQLALVRNTLVGLSGIDPAVIEVARGMGMNGWQRFWRIELPLALPLILGGVRLASIQIIGIGTIAAYVGAGGLGTLLFEGVITNNTGKIFSGALAVSLLAVLVNYGLYYLERRSQRTIRGDEPPTAQI